MVTCSDIYKYNFIYVANCDADQIIGVFSFLFVWGVAIPNSVVCFFIFFNIHFVFGLPSKKLQAVKICMWTYVYSFIPNRSIEALKDITYVARN